MIVHLLIVSGLVVLVDQVLKAFVYDVSRQLSVYIGLRSMQVFGRVRLIR
jgi:Na+-transporting NADH:ubiquinone oxidoreductase subunit D